MDAALVTTIGVIGSAIVAGVAAIYGSKVAREGNAVTGFNSLAQYLVNERDKAELDEATAEVRAIAAEARVIVLELENARLRRLVAELGGTP